MRKISILTVFLAFFLWAGCTLSGPPGAQLHPTTSPIALSPAPPAEVVSSQQGYQSTGLEAPPEQKTLRVGQMEIEYPLFLSPNSSGALTLTIYVTDLAEPVFENSKRVPLPADQPPLLDARGQYGAKIRVDRQMRAELDTLGLKIQPLQDENAAYPVNIDELDRPTSWQWLLQAPPETGSHQLALRIYLGGDVNPSWWGILEMQVVAPSPTGPPPSPTPTLTPEPPGPMDRLLEDILDNPLAWMTFLIATILVPFLKWVWDQRKKKPRK